MRWIIGAQTLSKPETRNQDPGNERIWGNTKQQYKQVESVWTPDLLRVKLIYLRLSKAIQKSISKNEEREKSPPHL